MNIVDKCFLQLPIPIFVSYNTRSQKIQCIVQLLEYQMDVAECKYQKDLLLFRFRLRSPIVQVTQNRAKFNSVQFVFPFQKLMQKAISRTLKLCFSFIEILNIIKEQSSKFYQKYKQRSLFLKSFSLEESSFISILQHCSIDIIPKKGYEYRTLQCKQELTSWDKKIKNSQPINTEGTLFQPKQIQIKRQKQNGKDGIGKREDFEREGVVKVEEVKVKQMSQEMGVNVEQGEEREQPILSWSLDGAFLPSFASWSVLMGDFPFYFDGYVIHPLPPILPPLFLA